MRVLIIEDDENKRDQLTSFFSESLTSVQVEIARSFQSGLRAVIRGGMDFIVLDMTMPTFDYGAEETGGRLQSFGGRDILRQMERRRIRTPVVVVTAFDTFGDGLHALTWKELDAELRAEHPMIYFGAVYYNVALTGWKEDLLARIRAITKYLPEGEP